MSCYPLNSSHPLLPSLCPQVRSLHLTNFCQLAQSPQCGSKNVTRVTEMMTIHKLKKKGGCLPVNHFWLSVWFTLNSSTAVTTRSPKHGTIYSEINQFPGGKVNTLDPINYRRANDLPSFSTTLTLDSSFLYLLNTLLSASVKSLRTLTWYASNHKHNDASNPKHNKTNGKPPDACGIGFNCMHPIIQKKLVSDTTTYWKASRNTSWKMTPCNFRAVL